MDRLRAACDRAGRDPDELQIVNGERSDVQLDAESTDFKEQASRAVDALAMYASMGVAHMKAGIRAADAASALRMIEWYGNDGAAGTSMIRARSHLLPPVSGGEPLFKTKDVAVGIGEVEPLGITPFVRPELVLDEDVHAAALELGQDFSSDRRS